MKKNLKLLISSVIIILTFASSRTIRGMEDLSKPGEPGVKSPDALSVSSDQGSAEESLEKKKRGEEIRENSFPFIQCPEDIKFLILERAAIANYLSDGTTGKLRYVCKDWRRIMNKDAMKKSIYELVYQRFLKGVLIYRPKEGSDDGMIKLPIKDLSNPLEGTFDLSQCGDTGNYLSISTGYRKGKKAENESKVEIWLAPRFLIEKELATTAKHFLGIYSSWNEQNAVGLFWTWGGWNDLSRYDYLTRENMDNLSKIDLYENWKKEAALGPLRKLPIAPESICMRTLRCLHVLFVN